ncbi:MAG: YhdT family protein [Thermoanaerobacteraceae bacterium]|nr:YhdT family protein [Thermoanaerobacteraceae bacterium]
MEKKTFKEDSRYKQTNKETLSMVILLIANIIWWYVFAYGLGSRPPEKYTYIMGFPAWFFWSCIVSFVLFSVLAWVIVSVVFKDIPIDTIEDENKGEDKK